MSVPLIVNKLVERKLPSCNTRLLNKANSVPAPLRNIRSNTLVDALLYLHEIKKTLIRNSVYALSIERFFRALGDSAELAVVCRRVCNVVVDYEVDSCR